MEYPIMRSLFAPGSAAALLLAGGLALGITGCNSDSRKADAGLARAGGEPVTDGQGGAVRLYTEGDEDTGRQRISQARPAAARASAGEIEMNIMSMTIPSNEEMLLLEARGPIEVRANEPFEYQVDVTNVSDRPLADITIREVNSENLEFVATDPEAEMSENEG